MKYFTEVPFHAMTSKGAIEPLPMAMMPSRSMMNDVFASCRKNRWKQILVRLEQNPGIALKHIVMENHIVTTVMHQAITSKGNTADRTAVIEQILRVTPQAAEMKNGYGSLPLHVIAQRNTKMKAAIKEKLIYQLIEAYPKALLEDGGVGKRCPLHIIFTDYVSPRLTQLMIDKGPEACFKRDKNEYLPAHVACSRHCSPEKLNMLLDVNPKALFAKTKSGDTLMSLAKKTATKSHPNYALIDMLERELQRRDDLDEKMGEPAGERKAHGDHSSPPVSSPVSSRFHGLSTVSFEPSPETSPRLSEYTASPMSALAAVGQLPHLKSPWSRNQQGGLRKRGSDDIEAGSDADLLLHFSQSRASGHESPMADGDSSEGEKSDPERFAQV